MSDPIIPTPQDTQLVLQDTVTKTASFTSAGKDLGSGYAPGGLGQPVAAVVNVTALDTADGNETYTFALHESDDNVSYAAAGATAAGAGGRDGRGQGADQVALRPPRPHRRRHDPVDHVQGVAQPAAVGPAHGPPNAGPRGIVPARPRPGNPFV